MGGLNASRKFEPDKFTDAEVEQFKREWRAAHPAIVKFWYAVDRAAWTAVRERGRVVRCGPVAFKSNGAFLQLKLPSGRKISYPSRALLATSASSASSSPITPRGNSGIAARPGRIRRPVDRKR